MAMILAFRSRQNLAVAKQQYGGPKGKIIIFPGVRYERLPEFNSTITKSAKKARKTA